MARKRIAFGSKEARAAHDARVDANLRRLREVAEKAQAELDAKEAREQNA